MARLTLEPLPFQKTILEGIFDPELPDGRRKVREALLMIPRKGGKTTLSAGLALYATFAGEKAGQVGRGRELQRSGRFAICHRG